MTNENGPQLHVMREGRAKWDIIKGLHVLCLVTGGRDKAAAELGVTRATLRHAMNGQKTEVKLHTVQRAFRGFVEARRGEVDKYEWACLLQFLRWVDPQADLLQVKVAEGLAKQVRKHMEDFPTNWPSAWLHHFARQGVNKETLRVTIRRIIAKNPEMAEYDIDYKDDYPSVMPDPIDKVIKWVGATEETPPKAKKSGGSAKPRKTSAPRPATSKAKPAKKKAPQELPVEPGEFVPSDDPEVRRKVDARLAKLLKSADQLPD